MDKRQRFSLIFILAVVGIGGALWVSHALPPFASRAHMDAVFYGNPDIMITGAIPEQVDNASPMLLTYTARNVGDGVAFQTYLIVHVPTGALFDRVHSDPQCQLKWHDVICSGTNADQGFTLFPGQAQTFTVALSVQSLACSQVIETSASAEVLNPADANLANNSMKTQTSVECGPNYSPFPVNSKGQWEWVQGQGWIFLLPSPSTFTRFDSWFWNTPVTRPVSHSQHIEQYFPQYSAVDSNRWVRR